MNLQGANMRIKTLFLSFILAVSFSTTAQAVTVTFENIPNHQIADGYGGISGWNEAGQVRDSGFGTGVGDYWFHSWGGELRFDNAPVVFEGVYYQSWGGNQANLSYSLYYQNQLVYSDPLDLNLPINPYWLASNYSGLVDKIYFYSSGDGIVLDNLTYSITAVPEPSNYVLLLSGLAVMGLLRRRGKRDQFGN